MLIGYYQAAPVAEFRTYAHRYTEEKGYHITAKRAISAGSTVVEVRMERVHACSHMCTQMVGNCIFMQVHMNVLRVQEKPCAVGLPESAARVLCRACLAMLPPKLIEDPIKCIRCRFTTSLSLLGTTVLL